MKKRKSFALPATDEKPYVPFDQFREYGMPKEKKPKKSSYSPLKEGPMHIYIYDEFKYSEHPFGSKERFMDKWLKREVVGQTSRSWVLTGTPAVRIPKDRSKQRGVCMSLYEIDALWTMQCLKPQIINQIEKRSHISAEGVVDNYSLLLSIAEQLDIPTHPVSKR